MKILKKIKDYYYLCKYTHTPIYRFSEVRRKQKRQKEALNELYGYLNKEQ